MDTRAAHLWNEFQRALKVGAPPEVVEKCRLAYEEAFKAVLFGHSPTLLAKVY